MDRFFWPSLRAQPISVSICFLVMSFLFCGSARGIELWSPRMDLGGFWEMYLEREGTGEMPSLKGKGLWHPILVPSNWYLTGFDHSGAAWFRKRFHVPHEFRNKVVRLVFEGVDYSADVWLNDRYLGSHEGYFEPFAFYVSDRLDWAGENRLEVRVNSPKEEYGTTWSLRKRLIKGVFGHHDTRPGGAWSERGQDGNTGGIWAPVYLRISDEVAIENLMITSTLTDGGTKGYVEVVFEIRSVGESPKGLEFQVSIVPHNFTARGNGIVEQKEYVVLDSGSDKVRLSLAYPSPELWWPWDRGAPNLYRLTLSVRNESRLLDISTKTFAFRSVTHDEKTGIWRINGEKVFLRGTNYISSQWLGEMNRERYAFDLMLMKRASVNAIRVHAHLEADGFYDLCDEMGILVLQDFPLQWGYSDDPAFVREAVRQIGSMVNLLHNHPCIIGWCAHNEPPWDAWWMKYKYSDYDPTQNIKLDRALFSELKALDRTRPAKAASLTAEHVWLGWYSGSWVDFKKPTKEHLITEYGAQAIPRLDSLQKIFAHTDLWPQSEEQWQRWEYRNFQRHETFEIARVKKGQSIGEFIENTQTYQARLIKVAAESYRKQKYKPVGGIFQFMFVESWPSISWGILDYWRNPKAGYEALQTAYQIVCPIIDWEKEYWCKGKKITLDFWVVNDSLEKFTDAELEISLWNETDLMERTGIRCNVDSDSVRRIGGWEKSGLSVGRYVIFVQLFDKNRKMLGRNKFEFKVGEGRNLDASDMDGLVHP